MAIPPKKPTIRTRLLIFFASNPEIEPLTTGEVCGKFVDAWEGQNIYAALAYLNDAKLVKRSGPRSRPLWSAGPALLNELGYEMPQANDPFHFNRQEQSCQISHQ